MLISGLACVLCQFFWHTVMNKSLGELSFRILQVLFDSAKPSPLPHHIPFDPGPGILEVVWILSGEHLDL